MTVHERKKRLEKKACYFSGDIVHEGSKEDDDDTVFLTQVRRHLMRMKRVLKCMVSGIGAGLAKMLFHSSTLA
jgi:hypothetical protein